MFKKILSTVKKEKTASSLQPESLETRLGEIHEVKDLKIEKNRLQRDTINIILDTNQYSQPLSKQTLLDQRVVSSDNVSFVDEVYYFPSFITQQDQNQIEEAIYNQDPSSWTVLPHSNRRLQKHGGDVTVSGLKNQVPLPDFLRIISEKLHKSNISPFLANHVLLNEYPRGIGIMPHTDGPLYYPWVNSISLGSSCVFEFYENMADYRDHKIAGQLLLESGSLVTFAGKAYKEWLHCIRDLPSDEIYLLIDEEEQESNSEIKEDMLDRKINVKKSSVLNYQLTEFRKILEIHTVRSALKAGLIEKVSLDGINEAERDKNEEIKGRNSKGFNYVATLPRDNRISLTIRQVDCEQMQGGKENQSEQ